MLGSKGFGPAPASFFEGSRLRAQLNPFKPEPVFKTGAGWLTEPAPATDPFFNPLKPFFQILAKNKVSGAAEQKTATQEKLT